jgi:hypothetical protein
MKRSIRHRAAQPCTILACVLALAGCGGGGTDASPAPPTAVAGETLTAAPPPSAPTGPIPGGPSASAGDATSSVPAPTPAPPSGNTTILIDNSVTTNIVIDEPPDAPPPPPPLPGSPAPGPATPPAEPPAPSPVPGPTLRSLATSDQRIYDGTTYHGRWMLDSDGILHSLLKGKTRAGEYVQWTARIGPVRSFYSDGGAVAQVDDRTLWLFVQFGQPVPDKKITSDSRIVRYTMHQGTVFYLSEDGRLRAASFYDGPRIVWAPQVPGCTGGTAACEAQLADFAVERYERDRGLEEAKLELAGAATPVNEWEATTIYGITRDRQLLRWVSFNTSSGNTAQRPSYAAVRRYAGTPDFVQLANDHQYGIFGRTATHTVWWINADSTRNRRDPSSSFNVVTDFRHPPGHMERIDDVPPICDIGNQEGISCVARQAWRWEIVGDWPTNHYAYGPVGRKPSVNVSVDRGPSQLPVPLVSIAAHAETGYHGISATSEHLGVIYIGSDGNAYGKDGGLLPLEEMKDTSRFHLRFDPAEAAR